MDWHSLCVKFTLNLEWHASDDDGLFCIVCLQEEEEEIKLEINVLKKVSLDSSKIKKYLKSSDFEMTIIIRIG